MIYYPDEDESAKEDVLVSQWDTKPGIPGFSSPASFILKTPFTQEVPVLDLLSKQHSQKRSLLCPRG